ncbi:GtrA family protein [bacterium]|nr:MAG: GtrA family protein [bacterium]
MSFAQLLRPDFIRFLCVGGTCFAVNLGVLYLVTEFLGAHYLVAMAVSIVVANSLGFILNRNWTFESRSASIWRELVRYFTVNLGQSALNLALMAFFVSVLGVHYLVASAGIAIVLTGANFLLHKNWSFNSR